MKVLFVILFFMLIFIVITLTCAFYLVAKRPIKNLYKIRVEQSDFCPISNIPKRFIHYTVMIEDHVFYKHHGFSVIAIWKSLIKNFKEGKIVVGASTITQQLAKNLYLPFVKSYLRKIIELYIAIYIEIKLNKEKILELYLNIIYFGMGLYGINDAANFYFNKAVNELSINQLFILTCIIGATTKGNPIHNPDRFEFIKNDRIRMLLDKKALTKEEEEIFKSLKSPNFDDELRKSDDYTRNFSKKVVMENERFGWQVPIADFGKYKE